LKRFVTRLNALAGTLVAPPLPGVETKAVPLTGGADEGFAITVVPGRPEVLTQTAKGKEHKDKFFIRVGSGFFPIPRPILEALFSRRPAPRLSVSVELAKPGETTVIEQVVEAEFWRAVTPGLNPQKKPWGRCVHEQHLALPWSAVLRNDGFASASE